MILLAATSKSDRAAYALMFRQLAQTARAIHDMHKATDDLRRVRGLAAAVTAASKVVEASATAQTTQGTADVDGDAAPTAPGSVTRKPSKQGSWPNVHEAAHRCLPSLTRPDAAQLQRQRSHGPKRPTETTIQSRHRAIGEEHERSRRNGRCSRRGDAYRADGCQPHRRAACQNARTRTAHHRRRRGTTRTAAAGTLRRPARCRPGPAGTGRPGGLVGQSHPRNDRTGPRDGHGMEGLRPRSRPGIRDKSATRSRAVTAST